MNEELNNLRWYVIQTKPRQENKTCYNLNSYGVQTFFPQVRKKYKNSRRLVDWYLEPLFPSYIFARFNYPDMFRKIRYTRGVYKIVGFGPMPCAVDEEVISIIRLNCSNDGYVQQEPKLKPGDQVVIKNPYLKDLIGIFQYETKNRVSILLTTIAYQAHINVSNKYVAPESSVENM